jgi:hypothetical protein
MVKAELEHPRLELRTRERHAVLAEVLQQRAEHGCARLAGVVGEQPLERPQIEELQLLGVLGPSGWSAAWPTA